MSNAVDFVIGTTKELLRRFVHYKWTMTLSLISMKIVHLYKKWMFKGMLGGRGANYNNLIQLIFLFQTSHLMTLGRWRFGKKVVVSVFGVCWANHPLLGCYHHQWVSLINKKTSTITKDVSFHISLRFSHRTTPTREGIYHRKNYPQKEQPSPFISPEKQLKFGTRK